MLLELFRSRCCFLCLLDVDWCFSVHTVCYRVFVALLIYFCRLSGCGCCYYLLAPGNLYVAWFPKASRLWCLNPYMFWHVCAQSLMFRNEKFLNKRFWNERAETCVWRCSKTKSWKNAPEASRYELKVTKRIVFLFFSKLRIASFKKMWTISSDTEVMVPTLRIKSSEIKVPKLQTNSRTASDWSYATEVPKQSWCIQSNDDNSLTC